MAATKFIWKVESITQGIVASKVCLNLKRIGPDGRYAGNAILLIDAGDAPEFYVGQEVSSI